MDTAPSTQGELIRGFLKDADEQVVIVAPFIKVAALRSILSSIPLGISVRCVTRWLPRDIAAGASDPEIIYVLEERGNFHLSLVDSLHAKLYVSGRACLVGSANVTLAALGEAEEGNNIEVLATVSIEDPGVAKLLNEISRMERPATRDDADVARRLANSLSPLLTSTSEGTAVWFPRSRRPEQAYDFYTNPPQGYLATAERILLGDVASANIQPGSDRDGFRSAVRRRLARIPLCDSLLTQDEDSMLTHADAQSYLQSIAGGEFSINDLWNSFISWMSYFYSDKVIRQEIAEVALRRAQGL